MIINLRNKSNAFSFKRSSCLYEQLCDHCRFPSLLFGAEYSARLACTPPARRLAESGNLQYLAGGVYAPSHGASPPPPPVGAAGGLMSMPGRGAGSGGMQSTGTLAMPFTTCASLVNSLDTSSPGVVDFTIMPLASWWHRIGLLACSGAWRSVESRPPPSPATAAGSGTAWV